VCGLVSGTGTTRNRWHIFVFVFLCAFVRDRHDKEHLTLFFWVALFRDETCIVSTIHLKFISLHTKEYKFTMSVTFIYCVSTMYEIYLHFCWYIENYILHVYCICKSEENGMTKSNVTNLLCNMSLLYTISLKFRVFPFVNPIYGCDSIYFTHSDNEANLWDFNQVGSMYIYIWKYIQKCICICRLHIWTNICMCSLKWRYMGWLRWLGCLKIQVSLQNTGLFCKRDLYF